MNKEKMIETDKELDYILGINPKAPGKDFNNDRACFARYCNMQAMQARNIAAQQAMMMQAMIRRDIAVPDFRQQARALGMTVQGVWVVENDERLNKIEYRGE